MRVKLYAVPASPPSAAAALMLERKGIEYRRVDLVLALHRVQLRALGFPGVTVPAMRVDGRRLQGSRNISRALDELRPEPPLFPHDPELRAAVEEAERWGDEVLQQACRRLVVWALRRNSGDTARFLEGANMLMPHALAARTSAPFIWMSSRYNGATDAAVRADLAALPGALDRVDALIAAGTIGGGEPNAADYQIAASLRQALSSEDLRPAIEGRPAAELAARVVPRFPGNVGPAFPDDWLAPLRAVRAS